MPSNDVWIDFRDRFIDLLGGIDTARTLNPPSSGTLNEAGKTPAAALIRLLDQVLAGGMADHGESMDYAALSESELYDGLRRCAAALRDFDPVSLPDRNAQLAFWINLYNALVMHGVIELGVERSVMERRAGITFFRQAAYIVCGLRLSCDDIEHGILRANRGHPFYPGRQFADSDARLGWVIHPFEPRIHFALNCASRSCPPIRVYTPDKLDVQLDLAARSFLSADVRISPDENAVFISSIFKWFAGDFGGRDGTLEFILNNLPDNSDVDWLAGERDRVALRFKPYDWSLNNKVPLESAHSSV